MMNWKLLMKVWLDDIREMPRDYDIHVKTSREAIKLLKTGKVELISLDHDLGEVDTGYIVALFIENAAYTNTIPKLIWKIHSANPVGRKRMEIALLHADEYWSNHEEKI